MRILLLIIMCFFVTACAYNDQKSPSFTQGTQVDDVNKVKIYFNVGKIDSLENSSYVTRNAKSDDVLSFAIQSYLQGVTEEEEKMGFKTNNLGLTSFNVKVEDRKVMIDFESDNLDIQGPDQILSFSYNVAQTAEQFKNIDNTEICINGIHNYQMVLLANEASVPCPFHFK